MKMKKKIVIILVLIILICTIPNVPSTTYKKLSITKPPSNNNYNNYLVIQKIKNQESIDENYPVMMELPNAIEPMEYSEKPTPINTPETFSWTNYTGYNWITPVKHQGQCGSCWAFAALGVYESMIKIREGIAAFNPDLSEQYLLSCIDGAGSCYGGSTFRALKLLNDTTSEGNFHDGIIFESCFSYQADHSVSCDDKCSDWESKLVPIYDFGTWRMNSNDQDREILKTQIMQNGPVATHLLATDLFKIWGSMNHDPSDYYYQIRPVFGINHVVMIVGWQDDSSVPSGGYWICKNSWGTDWGYNGFFNLAYGCLNADNSIIVWADYDPESYAWPPIANAGNVYTGSINEQIIFNASQSIGIEGAIVSYLWEFGDGTKSTEEITTHSYQQKGEYLVTLTVNDSKGLQRIDTTYARIQDINNHPPNKPTINGPTSGVAREELIFTISTTDSDGDHLYFYIDWGDNTEIYSDQIPYESGEEIQATHKWPQKGQYTLKVKAQDCYGAESDWAILDVTMPKTCIYNSIIQLLMKMLESFPFLEKILNPIII
jgi:C1A family cysteine protease